MEKKSRNKIVTIGITLMTALTLAGCSKASVKRIVSHEAKSALRSAINNHKSSSSTGSTSGGVKSSENKTADYKTLANSDFKSGTNIVVTVNKDKSTLNPSDWKTEKIEYGALDSLNRTTTDTAYLSKKSLGKSEGRDPQTWNPTGWNNQAKKVNGKRVFPMNRGHLLAYTLTFNFDEDGNYKQGADGSLDNPKNLASQTSYSNQQPMQQQSENLVRDALEKNKKVIYKVTTVFRGNEKMPRGYWVQAISTDKTLNFNRYIYNVQPGLKFDYSTGRSTVDTSMKVAE
jgi:DNA-entry nuclease